MGPSERRCRSTGRNWIPGGKKTEMPTLGAWPNFRRGNENLRVLSRRMIILELYFGYSVNEIRVTK